MNRCIHVFRFSKIYFLLFILLAVLEIAIGLYAHDDFIRPYGGDFLVVILLYCFIRGFLNVSVFSTALPVLLFAYFIETCQYFKLADGLGLRYGSLARTLLGDYFSWVDILSYTLGIGLVLGIEILQRKLNAKAVNR
jgi:hypothetical protein